MRAATLPFQDKGELSLSPSPRPLSCNAHLVLSDVHGLSTVADGFLFSPCFIHLMFYCECFPTH